MTAKIDVKLIMTDFYLTSSIIRVVYFENVVEKLKNPAKIGGASHRNSCDVLKEEKDWYHRYKCL